jgi:hypothetical protein
MRVCCFTGYCSCAFLQCPMTWTAWWSSKAVCHYIGRYLFFLVYLSRSWLGIAEVGLDTRYLLVTFVPVVFMDAHTYLSACTTIQMACICWCGSLCVSEQARLFLSLLFVFFFLSRSSRLWISLARSLAHLND